MKKILFHAVRFNMVNLVKTLIMNRNLSAETDKEVELLIKNHILYNI